jgi:hypothetical protein
VKRPTTSTLAVVLAVAATAVLARAAPIHAHRPIDDGGLPAIAFSDTARNLLVITTPGYRLTVNKRNGGLVDLVDRRTGTHLLRGQNGCLWAALPASDAPPVTGCAYQPGGPNRLSYRWDAVSSTLTLTYTYDQTADRRANAVAQITAHHSFFDLRLALESHWGKTIATVLLPADLFEDTSAVRAGYAPTYLPGIRFSPSFFRRTGNDVFTYPSRWAYADYLSLDLAQSHLALYTVNPAPAPIAPVQLGFVVDGPPSPCSGPTFCVTHGFQTWIRDGETWTSPAVRFRVGETVKDSILDYRKGNGIDAYPSLADKLGGRLAGLARAPLIKADPWKGLPPFDQWAAELKRLPSPALLHPVAFQPRGQDENDPDFLPPDPRWGTVQDLNAAVAQAHSLGQFVMPYLNISWWDKKSPTVQNLPRPLTIDDLAVKTSDGDSVRESYGPHLGFIVSPYVSTVRNRFATMMDEWKNVVPADCVFFDQIGARPWRRDFNPAAPNPLAYDDGWLALMAPYADRCLMVEDGWDRLAQSFAGFNGSALLLDRDFDEPNRLWGAGNWEPYPLADWLFHDKVLLYQHDLAESTMTADPEVLLFNAAFGFMLSYSWDDDRQTLGSPWLDLVGKVQRALGPLVAGQALTDYRDLAPDVTQTTFGGYSVVANWSKAGSFQADGYDIAPEGFLARTQDGQVLAGAFVGSFNGRELSPGTHYLVVERNGGALTVSQPLGSDTDLAVAAQGGGRLRAIALDAGGNELGEVPGSSQGGRFDFQYRNSVGGRPVASYRVVPG